MLAVFDKTVAKCPEGLKNAESEAIGCALKDDMLFHHFSSIHPDAVSVYLGGSGTMAFSSDKQNPLLPRGKTAYWQEPPLQRHWGNVDDAFLAHWVPICLWGEDV